MKLPLKVCDVPAQNILHIVDAQGWLVAKIELHPGAHKFAHAIVRKFNRQGWLSRLFGGYQPYEYTREDWLHDKPVKTTVYSSGEKYIVGRQGEGFISDKA